MSNISSKAMLTALHVSQWSGRQGDAQITKEVETLHNSRQSGKWTKYLIMAAALKPIQKRAGAARQFFYDHTLKWIEGWQLLPAAEYMDFMEKFAKYKSDFENEVATFLPTYQEWIDEARVRLNGMFNEKDYPTLEELRTKFSIEIVVSPVPEADDFRVTLSDDEVARIKEQIKDQMQDAQAEASRDLWNRVRDALKAMVETLSQQDKVFRNSLVGNVKELTTLLPRLNYCDDQGIIQCCKDMESLCVDPETLRTNDAMRGEVANRARLVLQSYGL